MKQRHPSLSISSSAIIFLLMGRFVLIPRVLVKRVDNSDTVIKPLLDVLMRRKTWIIQPVA